MNNSQKKPNIFQMIGSVIAAMFGVQSTDRRIRDFTHGKPWIFLLIGIVMTVLFVLTVLLVVQLVLANVQ